MIGCLPCHEAIVKSFATSGMGRSITRPAAEATLRQSGRFKGTAWVSKWTGTSLVHQAGGESHTMDWAVGSGKEGKSYLFQLGDSLFQSPLAWYARRKSWDLSPGYGDGDSIDFLRPVTADCLFCHAGKPAPIAGTINQYGPGSPLPEPTIGCSRCHGEAEEHARNPQRSNIVNPSRLAVRQRDSVCEQCHLSGVARIPNPGKNFADFRPGLALEDVFSVYVPAAGGRFKVVSHVEQLALSQCALSSAGKLWCGTCHDPHGGPASVKSAGSTSCLGCHTQTRRHGGNDCSRCHMPQTPAHDGGHTAFTDHRIQKPGDAVKKSEAKAVSELKAWREPAERLRDRGLGLAYAGTSEFKKALELLTETDADVEVQSALGLIHLRGGNAEKALKAMEKATRLEPGSATRRLNLAAVLLAAGQRERAKAEALRAKDLEPLLVDAYALLAEIEPARAAYWRQQYQTYRSKQ